MYKSVIKLCNPLSLFILSLFSFFNPNVASLLSFLQPTVVLHRIFERILPPEPKYRLVSCVVVFEDREQVQMNQMRWCLIGYLNKALLDKTLLSDCNDKLAADKGDEMTNPQNNSMYLAVSLLQGGFYSLWHDDFGTKPKKKINKKIIKTDFVFSQIPFMYLQK